MPSDSTLEAEAPALGAEPAMTQRIASWPAQVGLVLAKDLRVELRTGEVVITSGFFAVLVVVMASLSFYAGPRTRQEVGAGALWLSVAFAAVLALARTWQREREGNALRGLLVSPIDRSALFAGKAMGVLLFLLLVECLLVPLTALFFAIDLTECGLSVALLAVVASPGIAASGTLFGAMTVRTSARDLVLAIVLFPLLSPALLSAVVGTSLLFSGALLEDVHLHLMLLGVLDVIFVAGGLALFGTLIES